LGVDDAFRDIKEFDGDFSLVTVGGSALISVAGPDLSDAELMKVTGIELTVEQAQPL